jgi:hypothetical protein
VSHTHPFAKDKRGRVNTVTPQIPCAICYLPAFSTDTTKLRELRCPKGHVTLATAEAITSHTSWLATRLNHLPGGAQ